MTYKERLQADLALIEEYLTKAFVQRQPRADLYDAMRYSLLAPGKRLRPILTLESCRLCGGKVEDALSLGCAVEMVHTYSLIHDDLPCMDDDDLRRGRATNHKVYGEATAVLAGDGLLTAAFETIAEAEELPGSYRLEAVACLAAAAGGRGMVGGQALDMAGEGHALSLEEIRELQELKTGALIAAAAELGGIAAGAEEKQRCALRRYAQCLGLAFQVRDDMLDVAGDEATLGKSVGSDARKEKTTFVSLKGMDYCEALLLEKTQEAKSALTEQFSAADTAFLCWLADELVQRKK